MNPHIIFVHSLDTLCLRSNISAASPVRMNQTIANKFFGFDILDYCESVVLCYKIIILIYIHTFFIYVGGSRNILKYIHNFLFIFLSCPLISYQWSIFAPVPVYSWFPISASGSRCVMGPKEQLC